jgi:hypothetical protein
MNLNHTIFSNVIIAGLDELSGYTKELLFCRGIRLHIGLMHDDYHDTIAHIEVIPNCCSLT